MQEVKEHGEKVIRTGVLAQKHRLSMRQRQAVGFLLEKGRFTIQEFEGLFEELFPKVDRRTQGQLKKTLITMPRGIKYAIN